MPLVQQKQVHLTDKADSITFRQWLFINKKREERMRRNREHILKE